MPSSFLQALALPRPDPGGGAAAAHGAAMGLALLEKVVRLEQQRQQPLKNPAFSWHDLLARVRKVAEVLGRLQEEDVQAYYHLTRARAADDPGDLEAALEEATACPMRIMQQAQVGLSLLGEGGAFCKPHLVSDLLVACELLAAACRGAHHIARANLPLMPDRSRRENRARELAQALEAAENVYRQVRAGLLGR